MWEAGCQKTLVDWHKVWHEKRDHYQTMWTFLRLHQPPECLAPNQFDLSPPLSTSIGIYLLQNNYSQQLGNIYILIKKKHTKKNRSNRNSIRNCACSQQSYGKKKKKKLEAYWLWFLKVFNRSTALSPQSLCCPAASKAPLLRCQHFLYVMLMITVVLNHPRACGQNKEQKVAESSQKMKTEKYTCSLFEMFTFSQLLLSNRGYAMLLKHCVTVYTI